MKLMSNCSEWNEELGPSEDGIEEEFDTLITEIDGVKKKKYNTKVYLELSGEAFNKTKMKKKITKLLEFYIPSKLIILETEEVKK